MVECLWECVRDAGPPPPMPAGTIVVAPQALSVSVDVRPDSMLVGGADDWIAITVRVRNDGGTPVVVRTPRAWGDLDLRSFGFRASAERVAERYDEFMVDSSVIRFAPGEEKRWRMDVRARTFGAGRVSVRGVYVGQPSALAAFTVLP